MNDMRVALVTPGRTSSGGSAFAENIAPSLAASLGAEVIRACVPPIGRVALPHEVRNASHVVFVGSRAVSVAGAKTVFWPLNVAPLERHVVRLGSTGVRNRVRHLALLRRLGASVRAADGLVFGSYHARTLYQATYPVAATKPYSVNRGGMSSGLVPRPRVVEPTPPLVLLVSHLYSYKGIVEFVRAVSLAAPRLPGNIVFRVAGADRDPTYAERVHRLVTELGLDGRLRVAPASPQEMADLYAHASMAVFASTCENAGSFALYDGLHAEVPTVCSDRSSMPEMVGGYVRQVNPCKPDRMAEAIVEVMTGQDERERLGREAREWSALAPTWQDRASLLAAFLRELDR